MRNTIARTFVVLAVLALVAAACTNSGTTTTTTSAATTTQAVTTTEATTTTAEATTTTAAAEGVTALQVQQLVTDTFAESNRDLTLWDIQPGLGTIMIEYGKRFNMAKLAADAGDWGMAQYQLKEQVEIQEVGEATRPANADLLATFEHTYLDPLGDAIVAMDKDAFDAAFDAAVVGCNECHVGTDHADIKYAPSAESPQPFLNLEASESSPPGEESGHEAAAPLDDTTPLTWQELYDLVNSYFDTPDRSLTLWGIQPGLGTVMIEYGKRFAQAKIAADAGNWGMAQYQLKEQIEIQEVGETTRPANADLLATFEHTYLDPLSDAIVAMDKDAFDTAYDAAITGCNECHVGTGHPYVRYQTPDENPQAYLAMPASESVEPEGGESGHELQPFTPPDGMPTLDDATAMVEDRMNNIDRGLALWNIQPGLGTIMIEYGQRYAMTQEAANAENWPHAAYQLKEAVEYQEVGETTRPDNADLLKTFEEGPLQAVIDAVAAQDKDAFDTAYVAAIDACNACHGITGHPYVEFQEPPVTPVPWLDMAGNQ